jgi:hypothetical protein
MLKDMAIEPLREVAMRVLLVVCAMWSAMALASTPAAAQGAWCSEDMNSRNCGWYTLEQCQAAASGLGARCEPNPFAAKAPAVEPRKSVKRAKHAH